MKRIKEKYLNYLITKYNYFNITKSLYNIQTTILKYILYYIIYI